MKGTKGTSHYTIWQTCHHKVDSLFGTLSHDSCQLLPATCLHQSPFPNYQSMKADQTSLCSLLGKVSYLSNNENSPQNVHISCLNWSLRRLKYISMVLSMSSAVMLPLFLSNFIVKVTALRLCLIKRLKHSLQPCVHLPGITFTHLEQPWYELCPLSAHIVISRTSTNS